MTNDPWIAERFRLRASASRPPARFSKMDLVRTQKRVGVSPLPASYVPLVTSVGHGSVGGSDRWVEIFSPEAVVEETERLRRIGLPARSPWADPALLPGLVAVACFSFGDRLVWVSARERFVRVPSDPAYAVVDLGPDLGGALDRALHLMGAPHDLDLTAS